MATVSAIGPQPVSPAAPVRALRIVIEDKARIPADVLDLESFCRWAISDEYPQRGRFSYLRGTIWVDLSMEEMYTHNQVKAEINAVLLGLVKVDKQGRYLPDGMLLRNAAADLSTEPDGTFVSYQSLQTGQVQ